MGLENKTPRLHILGHLLEVLIKIWQFGKEFFESSKFGPFFPWGILCIC
jgi:hypothetical protein